MEEYRVIPGYDNYAVTCEGVVKSIERDLVLGQWMLNGYLIVDTFRGSLTETLPVHRAVALAWVENPKPDEFNIVNHKDGNPLNNWYENLEWTDHSGNNYHAVNHGLRRDNIPCMVREFPSGEVTEFSSIAQAAVFMGMRKDTSVIMLKPKQFGKLLAGRYEFKFKSDETPWFYEGRTELVPPSRYMVNVKKPDGRVQEIYSTKAFLKEYQLYRCPGRSIPALAEYASEICPDHVFTVRDSYNEEQYREVRVTLPSYRMVVIAKKENETIQFDSLSSCAKHFSVDRSSIVNRLANGKHLDGWTFIHVQLPS